MVPPVYSGLFLGCLLKVKTKTNAGKLGGSPGSGGLQENMRTHRCGGVCVRERRCGCGEPRLERLIV